MEKIPSKIPTEVFKKQVEPYLRKAKRGYVSRTSGDKNLQGDSEQIKHRLSMERSKNRRERGRLPSNLLGLLVLSTSTGSAYHLSKYRKWTKDGSLNRVWEKSLEVIREQLDFSELNLDGSYYDCKKSGASSLSRRGEQSAIKVEKRQRPPNFFP